MYTDFLGKTFFMPGFSANKSSFNIIHRNVHSCFDKALFFKLYVCLYACAPIYRMILKLRVVMTQGWLEKYKTSKFHKLKKEISQNASFVHSKNFPRTRRANKGREYLLEYVV